MNADPISKIKPGKGPSELEELETLIDLSSQGSSSSKIFDENSEKNLEFLFSDTDLINNEKTFIEILYFSPLSRAGCAIDRLLR